MPPRTLGALPSPAEQALTSEVESFMGTLGSSSSSSTAEQLALRFCKARRGGCSWSEALVVLDRANQGSRPSLDPADYERATQRMQGSRPLQPLEVCSRVPAASLDASTFLEQYVAASRPVVLTGCWRICKCCVCVCASLLLVSGTLS